MAESYKVETSAGTFYYKVGTKNVLHRTDGPAAIYKKEKIIYDYTKRYGHHGYETKIKVIVKIFYENGVRHNKNGYAYSALDPKSKEVLESNYFYYGKEYYAENLTDFKSQTKLKSFQ